MFLFLDRGRVDCHKRLVSAFQEKKTQTYGHILQFSFSSYCLVVVCLAWCEWHVCIGCLYSGAEEEVDYKHTALVCDSKRAPKI